MARRRSPRLSRRRTREEKSSSSTFTPSETRFPLETSVLMNWKNSISLVGVGRARC